MPAARTLPILGDLGRSSSSTLADSNFLSYDQPPGPDKLWKHHKTKDAFLPSRRRSWVDVVDQCSEQNTERISTITDISSLADSRCSAQAAQIESNGAKRRSWEQLIDEDAGTDRKFDSNLATPLPTLPVPYANPALHMMTVRNDGRLARVHLYNKKRGAADKAPVEIGICLKNDSSRKESSSASSKTSTMSEFILVPSKTALGSSSPSSCSGDDDSRRFRHDFGKSKKGSSSMNSRCPWTISRKTTFVMILTAALLLTSAVGGYLLRKFIIGRRTVYELTFPTSQGYEARRASDARWRNDRSPTTLRLVVNEPSLAEFFLSGTFPYQNVRTVVDFDKKLAISRNLGDLSNYCFLTHLDESAFPTIDSLKEAAENSLSKSIAVSWPEDWRWKAELINDNLRDNFYFDSESRQQCGNNFYWLQKIDRDTSTDKCVDCGEVCIPAYGVTRVDGRRPLLVPTGRDCFWLSSASSPVGKPFVNNPNSGDSYIYGFGGGSFPNQQRAQMDTAALRPFVQQVQQSGPWIYQNQQPYPNFYRPSAGSNFGPSGGFAMTRTK